MPLYEYLCQDCGEQSELLVGSREQPECPRCGAPKLSKLLSIVAAPSRGTPTESKPPGGSCGSGCGCHPAG